MAGRGSVAVREATADDVDAFASFLRTAWASAGPGAPGFAGATDDIIAELTQPEAILARLGGPERRLYLASSGEGVVGFAATHRIDGDAVELAGIIVLPDASGRGVGTLLVRTAMDAARAEGFRSMLVRTETTNDLARSFYQHNGFVVGATAIEDVDGMEVPVVELEARL